MIRFATVFGFIILRISQCSSNIAQVLDTFPRQTVQRLDLYSKENVSDLDLEFLVDLKIPFRIHQNTFDLSGIEKQHLVWVNDVKASDMLSFVSNTSNAVLTHNYWFLSVDNNTNIPEYFTTNTKRFSLNIQLFFVLRNKSQIIVKQVVGTATTKVQIQVMNNYCTKRYVIMLFIFLVSEIGAWSSSRNWLDGNLGNNKKKTWLQWYCNQSPLWRLASVLYLPNKKLL